MGYLTKIQLIQRRQGQLHQWYVNFPVEVAQRMGFSKGEVLEWTIINPQCLVLGRKAAPAPEQEFKKKAPCSRV